MKYSYKIELTERETELNKSVTGEEIRQFETTMEVPEEVTELICGIVKAIPQALSLWKKMKSGACAPEVKINGEIQGETPEETSKEEQAA